MSGGEVYARVANLTSALERTYRLAGLCDKQAAALCGIDYNQFQRMMRPGAGRHFPPDQIDTLLRGCGNLFALEWQAAQFGMVLYPAEVIEVLRAVREVLRADGRQPRFLLLLDAMIARDSHGLQ